MVVIGLFIMLGIAIMIVGIVWTILNKIKKQSIKKGLASLVVGLVIIVIATVSTLFIGSDYQALNTAEGDKFAQLIQNGEDINNKTLTFTVADKGKDSPMGVGLSIPTSEGVLNVVLESNQDTQKIKVGDTITVRMDSMGSVLGMPLIQSRFVNYQ